MTDEDVVARVAQAFGVSYSRCAIRSERWRQTFTARLRGESAVKLMRALRPMMGQRRKGQIDRALASWNPQARKVRPEDEGRILELLAGGHSYRSVAKLTGISHETVGNVLARNHGALAQCG